MNTFKKIADSIEDTEYVDIYNFVATEAIAEHKDILDQYIMFLNEVEREEKALRLEMDRYIRTLKEQGKSHEEISEAVKRNYERRVFELVGKIEAIKDTGDERISKPLVFLLLTKLALTVAATVFMITSNIPFGIGFLIAWVVGDKAVSIVFNAANRISGKFVIESRNLIYDLFSLMAYGWKRRNLNAVLRRAASLINNYIFVTQANLRGRARKYLSALNNIGSRNMNLLAARITEPDIDTEDKNAREMEKQYSNLLRNNIQYTDIRNELERQINNMA